MRREGRCLPTGVRDFPGDLHLLGGALVQLLEAARQLPLYGRRLHGPPAGVHAVPVRAAAERRAEYVVPEDGGGEPRTAAPHAGHPTAHAAAAHATAAHAAEGAGAAEELGEDVLRVARVEPEHRRPVAAGGEEGCAAGPRPAGARRRHLPLKTLLAVLVVHRALLRVAQHLHGHREPEAKSTLRHDWAGWGDESGVDLLRTPTYLVRLRDLLELVLGLLLVVGVLVGVPFHGELAVGLLEVVIGGALVDA
uniref:Uncharacterized protein n=1 Tax=Zea mays TaxID=4577 RepID=A0A804Q345_MAIZE